MPPTPKGAMDSDKKKYQQFLQGAFEKYKNTSQDVMIKFRHAIATGFKIPVAAQPHY